MHSFLPDLITVILFMWELTKDRSPDSKWCKWTLAGCT